MGALEKLLNKSDKGNSLFEAEIRNIKIPVCKQFLKGGKISPVDFKPSKDSVSTKDSTKVFASFPNLRETASKVMEGG